MNWLLTDWICWASQLDGSYWVGDASVVIPEEILASAPNNVFKTGLVLYVGYEGSPLHFYLIPASGTYDVLRYKKKALLGQAEIDGFLVLADLDTLAQMQAEALIVDSGVVVEFEGLQTIDLKKKEIRIGDVRIKRAK